ncbi:MAG: hypothetical protein ACFFD4_11025 [Candidatus Odinarchaeota archaeon]
MAMRNFDLTRIDGLLGIYLLGGAFVAFISSMVISIVGKSEDVFVAVVLFDTAFYIILAGALLLVAGVILLLLNSQAAASSSVTTAENTRLAIIGLLVLTLVSAILYVVVPNFV